MIDVFYFSICGKKPNDTIDGLIQKFIDSEYTPSTDKKILKHVQKVALNGNYPAKEYFTTFYSPTELVYKSLAEIVTYCKAASEFYHKQWLDKQVITAINETESASELTEKIQSLTDSQATDDDLDLDSLKPKTYGSTKNQQLVKGINTGVKELDDVTYGLQPGTVGAICAFTSHGKSTMVESILFKNALEGKKSILLSLELAPDIVWSQFEARYMNQVKGIQVNSQDLMFRKMPSDIEEKVLSAEDDFQNEIGCNIVVIDESFVSKQIMLNYKLFSQLIKRIATKLGGVDIVAFDHVGQFELMYPDCGNQIIKNIQSFTKTFVDSRGVRPVSLMAVQANRQGEARARKRGGVYDLQAISDLNECAASHTTVRCSVGSITYGSLLKRVQRGEHITIKAYDYTTSQVVDVPIVDAFNTGTVDHSYEWRKLTYDGAPKDMIFTPTHKMLINGEKVALKDLPHSFEADSIGVQLNEDAEQVLIGTLLGDSVISKTDKSLNGYHVRLLQGTKQLSYLKWKVAMLQDLAHEPHKQGSRECYCASTISSSVFAQYDWTHTRGFKGITSDNLSKVNWLALLVWYLDDGCLVQDSENSYHCVFSCTNFGEQGAKLMQERLYELGLKSSLSVVVDKRSSKKQIQIRLHAEASRLFMSKVAHLIDEPCVEYKLKSTYKDPVIPRSNLGLCKTLVTQEVYKFPEQVKAKPRKKYNFTVGTDDHNYALPGGVLTSNCERTSTYIIFMYTSDDMKIMQETKITLSKHRLGPVITEPVVTTFNPGIITVGATIEDVSMSDDDFNDLDLDLGDSFDDF